jgi:hypothetical protein
MLICCMADVRCEIRSNEMPPTSVQRTILARQRCIALNDGPVQSTTHRDSNFQSIASVRDCEVCEVMSGGGYFHSGDNINAVVADIGSYASKIGFAGEDFPKAYFRSVRVMSHVTVTSCSYLTDNPYDTDPSTCLILHAFVCKYRTRQ